MAFPGAPCPAPTRPRAATSPVAPRATPMRQILGARRGLSVYNVERLLTKFETAATLVPPRAAPAKEEDPPGRGLFRLHQPGHERGAGGAGRGRHSPRRVALARLPLQRMPCRIFWTAHEQVFVVEQNRDAQMHSLLVNEWTSTRRGWCQCCTLMAHPSPRASSARPSRPNAVATAAQTRSPGGRRHDLDHQTPPAPPHAGEKQGGLHPPRLRGQDLHPVRGLRARLDFASPSSRPAGSWTSNRTAWPNSRALAAVPRRPIISSVPRTASTPCTGACPSV
jgi:hypothetical protein